MHRFVVKHVLPVVLLLQIAIPSAIFSQERGLSRTLPAAEQHQAQALKLAVVVGINRYSSLSGVSPLQYAVADAQALKNTLENQGYSVLALYDGEATAQFIHKAIKKITQLAHDEESRRNATLLFSFSGHGFAVDEENYLVTYDTDREHVTETGYPLSELIDLLKSTGIAQKVLFIDACRNNPGQKSASESFVQQQAEGVGILFSTRSGDVSYESASVGGGIFSHYLVKGLDGDAADNDGAVTLHSLKRFVEHKVPQWTIKNLQTVQTPYQAGEYTGEFLLARVPFVDENLDMSNDWPENEGQAERNFSVEVTSPNIHDVNAVDEITNNNSAGEKRLTVWLDPIDELANHFSESLSDYLTNHFDISIVEDQRSAAYVLEISANSLQLSRAGQSFTLEGDLLIEGYASTDKMNELSQEFVSIKGVSYKNERLAVDAAVRNWTENIGIWINQYSDSRND